MALQFYNTLGRSLQSFNTITPNVVKIYSCGPTVYNYVHIGNLRAYIFVDLLKRYLQFKGFQVIHVMNLTDVDDKTIRDSQKEGKSLKEFTEFYTQKFLEDIHTLSIIDPTHMPKATDFIDEMVQIILKMKAAGKTYEKDGSTYCRISEIEKYGELACLDHAHLKENADGRLNDADEYEKENARDFALWKSYSEEDGPVFWETELGKGRPGWHIECSAMSSSFLGETFDIHTGGVDLIFPHHTNEIAQSESANGKKFVNFWLHNNHLIVNGEKMSKSLGNFYTLNDLLKKGYSPRAIRYEMLKAHYRAKLDFREDELKKIPEILAKFDETINKLYSANGADNQDHTMQLCKKALTDFESAMDIDLNISGGLAAVFEFMTTINSALAVQKVSQRDAKLYLEALQKIDSVLGIMDFSKDEIPENLILLAEKRLEAKKAKDWKTSDQLRDEIKSLGYTVLDEKEGYRIKKV